MTFLLPEKQTSGLQTPSSIFENFFADENWDRIKKKDSNNKDDEDEGDEEDEEEDSLPTLGGHGRLNLQLAAADTNTHH